MLGINPARPKTQGPSTLDRIAQGLQIAQGVLGVSLAIPEYLAKKKQADAEEQLIPFKKMQAMGSILDNATVTTPDDPDAIRLPSLFPGKDIYVRPGNLTKGLQTEKLISDLSEDRRKRTPLTESQRIAYRGWLQEVGIKDISDEMIPQTVGALEEDRKARLSAMQITPQQEREFTYKVGKDIEEATQKKQARYIKDLDQYADTEQDAKDVKTALANKRAIERMVDEMISLREKHPNGTLTDREDIARARSLATQALLKYKNLALLGVLSKTDIELVDKLIPGNPLEVNPSGIIGQDPTMARLKQLKKNLNEDHRIFLETKGFIVPEEPKTKNVNGKTYRWVP